MSWNIELFKDILYVLGSFLGLVIFYRKVRQREGSRFTYRTEFGNEVHPLLVSIHGDVYNLFIADEGKSIMTYKFSSDTNFSSLKYEKLGESARDKSSFYPLLKQGEAVVIDNSLLNMKPISLKYEDKYSNRYYQIFEFDKSQLMDEDRIKRKSRSCYRISKRFWRLIWIWWPIF